MKGRGAAVALLLLLAAAPPEPAGYRMADYNAPTPSTLSGATVLDTAEAHALWERKAAVFIDVLPRPPRPEGLPAGTIWRDQPRRDIPDSIWLPNTGYGALAAPVERYFQDGLRQATGGDRHKTIVFYCKPDCWMSWNAAKRALALGYDRVGWYPAGAEGWEKAGYPLEERQPAK